MNTTLGPTSRRDMVGLGTIATVICVVALLIAWMVLTAANPAVGGTSSVRPGAGSTSTHDSGAWTLMMGGGPRCCV